MVTLNDFDEAESYCDLEQAISQFEIGTDVLKIFKKRAPEKMHLSVKRWSRQIVWNKVERSQKKTYEGISIIRILVSNILSTIKLFTVVCQLVDLRDVKDIRSGKNSTNYDLSSKLPTDELDENRCCVVCYTCGFNINTLSICGRSFFIFTSIRHFKKLIKTFQRNPKRNATIG